MNLLKIKNEEVPSLLFTLLGIESIVLILTSEIFESLYDTEEVSDNKSILIIILILKNYIILSFIILFISI